MSSLDAEGLTKIAEEQPIAITTPAGEKSDLEPTKKSELGEEPQICVCPHCKYQGYSFVERDPGCCIFLMCTGCVCMGCVAGCCLMPCVVTDFKDVTHYCVNCGLKIGTHPIFFC